MFQGRVRLERSKKSLQGSDAFCYKGSIFNTALFSPLKGDAFSLNTEICGCRFLPPRCGMPLIIQN